MGLLDDVVALANDVTQDLELQAVVTYEGFLSASGSGARNYSAARQVHALVEHKQVQVRKNDGQLAMARAKVTILDPTILVTVFDRITLPDGSTGPILTWEGFVPGTNVPILSEIYLG